MKLTQTQVSSAHHICVFGDPKTGKSTLVGKLAQAGYNLVWVSIDNGHSVLYKLPQVAQERIELIRLPDTREFPVGIATCLKIASGAKLNICDLHGQVSCSVCTRNKAGFSTVHCREHDNNTITVFDNISALADSAMNFATEGKPDGYKSTYDDFRMQGFLMNKFLTDLQQAPWHSICIAHVCETTMEDDGKKLVPWIGSVPFSRQAGKYFDHMVYLNVRNKKHIGGSSSTFDIRAVTGSRTDVAIEDEGKYKEFSLAPIMKSVIVREGPKEAARIIEGLKKTLADNTTEREKLIAAEENKEINEVIEKEKTDEIKEPEESLKVTTPTQTQPAPSNAKAALALLALKGKR
jgi:hypothetical protein